MKAKNLVLLIATLAVLILNTGCAVVLTEGGGYSMVRVIDNTGPAVNSRGVPYGYYPSGTVTTVESFGGFSSGSRVGVGVVYSTTQFVPPNGNTQHRRSK